MRFIRIFSVVIIFFTFLSSCETTDCISFSSNYVIFQYFDKETEGPKNVDFQYIVSLEANLILYKDTTLNIFYLPVNTETKSSSYLFLDMDNEIDTVTISYEKREKLQSKDCGFELQFSNLEVPYTSYDSISIIVNTLNRLNEENIRIYR